MPKVKLKNETRCDSLRRGVEDGCEGVGRPMLAAVEKRNTAIEATHSNGRHDGRKSARQDGPLARVRKESFLSRIARCIKFDAVFPRGREYVACGIKAQAFDESRRSCRFGNRYLIDRKKVRLVCNILKRVQ